jgi:hypothetical protein
MLQLVRQNLEQVPMLTRRPGDYFRALPPARQLKLTKRIRKMYAYIGAKYQDDCGQEALLQILESPNKLEIGPEPTNCPNSVWYDDVEQALGRFANSNNLKGAIFRTVFSKSRPREVLEDSEDLNKRIDMDAQSDSATAWFEDKQHWLRVYPLLRDFLLSQLDIDPVEVQIIDTLHFNALRAMHDPATEECFRGETLQINTKPLLKALMDQFPEVGWDIEKLRVALAKLRRHAERHKEAFKLRALLGGRSHD